MRGATTALKVARAAASAMTDSLAAVRSPSTVGRPGKPRGPLQGWSRDALLAGRAENPARAQLPGDRRRAGVPAAFRVRPRAGRSGRLADPAGDVLRAARLAQRDLPPELRRTPAGAAPREAQGR